MSERAYAIPAQENVEIQCGGALGRHRSVADRAPQRRLLRSCCSARAACRTGARFRP